MVDCVLAAVLGGGIIIAFVLMKMIERTKKKSMPQREGPREETLVNRPIIFYHFGRSWTLPDASPFCVKVETYFKLKGIEYERRPLNLSLGKKAKSDKRPFIEISENCKLISDSSVIIEYFENQSENKNEREREPRLECAVAESSRGWRKEEELTEIQRATSHAMRKMLEESTYWTLVATRWQNDTNFEGYLPIIQSSMPNFMPKFVSALIMRYFARPKVISSLRAQGYGHHDYDSIQRFGIQDFTALSSLLANDYFFFNSSVPSLLDVVSFSFVSAFIEPDIPCAIRSHLINQCPNLVRHSQLILSLIQPL